MKNTPTYSEQWQKITSAYVNNELDPLDGCACFIGNMLNKKSDWEGVRTCFNMLGFYELINGGFCFKSGAAFIESYGYTPIEIVNMENNFLGTWEKGGHTEDSLYLAMTTTLEMLRKIHEAKGDETAKEIVLTKRVLASA